MNEAQIMLERSMRSVFVGNIPFDLTEERLKEIFSEVGPVLSFKLVYDRENGKPKGYGFCEYKDIETANSAMRNLNGFEVGGRSLKVDNAANEKTRMEMQNSLNEPTEDSFDHIAPDKVPEAISKAVASLPPEQMFELMKQMKQCIKNNPAEARTMLLQNPQLAYGLLQSMVVMRIVDPETAVTMLHKPHGVNDERPPPPPPINSEYLPNNHPSAMNDQQHAVDPRGRMMGNMPPQNLPPPNVHPMVPPGPPNNMMNVVHNMPQGDVDLRQLPMQMGPMPVPAPGPMPQQPPEPILRDPRQAQMPQRDLRPMDPRGGGQAPPIRNPPGMMPPQRMPNTAPPPPPQQQPQQQMPTLQQQQQMAAGMASMAGMGGAVSDQEKAALIMQVLQLTDEQISMLPPEQRQSILLLKEQIAKSQR